MKKLILGIVAIAAIACTPNTANYSIAHDTNTSEIISKLHVSATGKAAQTPDQALVSAGVVTVAPTASAAMSENAKKMNAVFEALKAAGIAERDIMTSQMSLRPQYDYQNRRTPRITGYEVRNTVMAKTNNLEKTGAMLDALVKAGVNNINSVNFSIKDTKSAKEKARTDAIRLARQKAESMAKAAGVRLGRILEIKESGGYNAPMPMLMARDTIEMKATPIAAGEQTLSVTVNIVYVIE